MKANSETSCRKRSSGFWFALTLALGFFLALFLFSPISEAAPLPTKFIVDNPTGGDCATIGTWDNSTKTCILSQDMSFAGPGIIIQGDGITLNGAGHTITGPGMGVAQGIVVDSDSDYVTVRDVIVRQFGDGIFYYLSDNGSIVHNDVSDCLYGIRTVFGVGMLISQNITGGAANGDFGILLDTIQNSTLHDNVIVSHGTGLGAFGSNGNMIYNNIFDGNVYDQAYVAGGYNSFNEQIPLGGNYWSDWTVPDANGDGFVDVPRLVFGNPSPDGLPWAYRYGWDSTFPTVGNLQPTGMIYTDSTTVSIDYNDSQSGIDTSSVALFLDGWVPIDPAGCLVTSERMSCPVSGLAFGPHNVHVQVADRHGMAQMFDGSFDVGDNVAPVLTYTGPTGTISEASPVITASYTDAAPSSGINPASATLILNGGDPTSCTVDGGTIRCGTGRLANGHYDVRIAVADNAGNTSSVVAGFSVMRTMVIKDDPTGGDCTLIGTWDEGTRTCRMNTDLVVAGVTGIQVDGDSITLDGAGHAVSGLDMDTSTGVYASGRTMLNISNLAIDHFRYGVLLVNATMVNVTGEAVAYCQDGIFLDGSHFSTIAGNHLIETGATGIRLNNASNNQVNGNTLLEGDYGFYLYGMSSENQINTNTVFNNEEAAIFLMEGAHTNIFESNHAFNNMYGVEIWNCVGNNIFTGNTFETNLYGVNIWNSMNNSFIHNNFIANAMQATVNAPGNTFSMAPPQGGNHWSEWTVPNNNGDGFVDSPYVFAGDMDALPWTTRDGWLDVTPPVVTNILPTGTIYSGDAVVSADYGDAGSGINTATVNVTLDGGLIGGCTVGAAHVTCPVTDLTYGSHTIGGSVRDNSGNEGLISGSFFVGDNVPPTVTYGGPTGWVATADPTVTATYYDAAPSSGFGPATIVLNGGAPLPCTVLTGTISCSLSDLEDGHYEAVISLTDNADNVGTCTGAFDIDTAAPVISNTEPVGDITDNTPKISADFADDGIGIDPATIDLTLDGNDVTADATISSGHIVYTPATTLSDLGHSIHLEVADQLGHLGTADWTLNVTHLQSYFTWYDMSSPGASNWVLMANPADALEDAWFELYIAGSPQYLEPLPGCVSGQVPPGEALTPAYPGLIGGPVDASYHGAGRAIISQRTLWAGNSLEEVLGTDSTKLSDHYYWSWYDMQTAGFINWVMVANPNNFDVYYEIRIGGLTRPVTGTNPGIIPVGGRVMPTFTGVMGGPLEVLAFSDSGKTVPAQVMASQRVLTNNNSAFNEVPGIPADALSNHYLWTWYDMSSPGASNWVLVMNPHGTRFTYEIKIAGVPRASGILEPRGDPLLRDRVTMVFPGVIGGPVEVIAFDTVIASQRTLWGPSFEEVPGYPAGLLSDEYHWTWYDQQSAGMSNWVMVANPNAFDVYYEIRVGGVTMANGTLEQAGDPGGLDRATPAFPTVMGGPVDVKAWTDAGKSTPADVMASQRVLHNGYFNEVLGTVL